MKSLFLAFTLLLPCLVVHAQPESKVNATQLVEQLLNAKVFIDYNKIKKEIENQAIALNKLPNLSSADYATLQNGYNQTKASFDGFLGVVRQDMLDFQLFEKAATGDEPTILRYLNAYNAGVDIYNREFQPTYNKIVKTRALKDWLEPLALQAFSFLSNIFKGKNPRKDLLINDLLLISKTLFLQKMEMKTWEALVTVQPSGNVENTSPPSPTQPFETPPAAMETPEVPLEQPVMKTLSGELEFVTIGNQPLRFVMNSAATRDLTVGEATTTTPSSVPVNIPVLQTTESHGDGTAFQIRVQNSALLYAFALNSNGKCAPIYPFSEAWVRGFQMSKTRDLSVGPLMLQDAPGSTIIPAKNANTGAENYIKISGTSTKEQLCLIVTKSELDLQDVITRIEQLTGSLAERVAALWQSEPHCANASEAGLNVNGNIIQFNITNEAKWLLPLVFEIQR